MDRFLFQTDETGELIQSNAAELYHRLNTLDTDTLGIPDHCLQYYKSSHSKRLFFSIETSAHLLYKALQLVPGKIDNVILMDYGAGVGTLYLLAKMIGCKMVIYNDHLDDWRKSAELIAKAIGVEIDRYIVGDIEDCLEELKLANVVCDLIISRNVIEHIYKLDQFYRTVYNYQPGAIIFSSTTANKNNPASVIKHRLWHRKWEKVFKGKRLSLIRQRAPGFSADKINILATATRGKAAQDLEAAIEEYKKSGMLPDPTIHGSNTCDPDNGVWAEHLVGTDDYRKLINEQYYDITFQPGFWDTHYSKMYMNMVAKFFNGVIARVPAMGLRLAPFIYVIAKPRKKIAG